MEQDQRNQLYVVNRERQLGSCGHSCYIWFYDLRGAEIRQTVRPGWPERNRVSSLSKWEQVVQRPECGNTCPVHVTQDGNRSGTGKEATELEEGGNLKRNGRSFNRILDVVDPFSSLLLQMYWPLVFCLDSRSTRGLIKNLSPGAGGVIQWRSAHLQIDSILQPC